MVADLRFRFGLRQGKIWQYVRRKEGRKRDTRWRGGRVVYIEGKCDGEGKYYLPIDTVSGRWVQVGDRYHVTRSSLKGEKVTRPLPKSQRRYAPHESDLILTITDEEASAKLPRWDHSGSNSNSMFSEQHNKRWHQSSHHYPSVFFCSTHISHQAQSNITMKHGTIDESDCSPQAFSIVVERLWSGEVRKSWCADLIRNTRLFVLPLKVGHYKNIWTSAVVGYLVEIGLGRSG